MDLWGKIQAEPQAFGEMIRIWLAVASVAGAFVMDDKLEKILMMAISVTITFFTRKASTANVNVEAKVQKEVLHREATGTGIGISSMPTSTGDGRV